MGARDAPHEKLIMPSAAAEHQSTEVTRLLADHICALRFEDIPEHAIEGAKRFMLDTLAVAWAGSDAPGCPQARAMLAQEGSAPASTVWSWGDRMSAASAAFLNGMSAAALDFDSLGRDSPSHVNVVVLPAALAVAEQRHASGKAFLTALVCGCDLMCRLGAASEAAGGRHRGWFYTSVHGVFAAAAAAAKLLRVGVESTLNALGLAYSQAGGTQQVIVEPGLAKRMGSAFAARAGVFAAQLAERGLTGPKASVEGDYGLFRMYQEGSVPRLLGGLGRSFENANLSIKKFPSCGCNHAALEAALQLAAENDLAPADVDSIEVEISEFMNRLVGAAFDPAGDPQAAAQFSIRYSIGCALTRRRFGLSELDAGVIHDPAIRALGDKVKVIVDPDNHGKRGPAVLRVHSRRHGLLSRRIDHVPGSEQSPLSASDIESKCRDCFALGPQPLDAGRAERLMARVAKLEEVADMATFFDGIV
jgi:2-methylcitrate dehydratase PrpD